MTDSTEAITDTSLAPAPATEVAHRNTRLYQVLAWVGIVAGILFIVGAVFVSGFLAGRTADGYGWHRGAQSGQMQPGGPMGGGCPMMQRSAAMEQRLRRLEERMGVPTPPTPPTQPGSPG